MPLHVVLFGRAITVPLLRVQVHEDRAVAEVPRLLEDALDREQVVTVDGSEVRESELLEQEVGDEECLEAVEDAPARLLGEVASRHVLEDLTRDVLRRPVGLRGAQRLQHP